MDAVMNCFLPLSAPLISGWFGTGAGWTGLAACGAFTTMTWFDGMAHAATAAHAKRPVRDLNVRPRSIR
jgi:hypothetical protein